MSGRPSACVHGVPECGRFAPGERGCGHGSVSHWSRDCVGQRQQLLQGPCISGRGELGIMSVRCASSSMSLQWLQLQLTATNRASTGCCNVRVSSVRSYTTLNVVLQKARFASYRARACGSWSPVLHTSRTSHGRCHALESVTRCVRHIGMATVLDICQPRSLGTCTQPDCAVARGHCMWTRAARALRLCAAPAARAKATRLARWPSPQPPCGTATSHAPKCTVWLLDSRIWRPLIAIPASARSANAVCALRQRCHTLLRAQPPHLHRSLPLPMARKHHCPRCCRRVASCKMSLSTALGGRCT